MFGRPHIQYKTREQVLLMRRAGLVVADALAAVQQAAQPGMTTGELDEVASDVIIGAGADASFLGYEGFPASICTSVNDAVIHAIPGGTRLHAGDIVSIDCGAIVDGWHGDGAMSFLVGEGSAADECLVATTEQAMWAAIAALAGGGHLNVVGEAVEQVVAAAGTQERHYGIVEDYVGHGIGTEMHQDPDVLNYRSRERGPRLRSGMCLAIEPMLTAGRSDVCVCEDDWTVMTADGSRAAHWEHTVAILDDGISVLTAHDGGVSGLAPYGVTPVQLVTGAVPTLQD